MSHPKGCKTCPPHLTHLLRERSESHQKKIYTKVKYSNKVFVLCITTSVGVCWPKPSETMTSCFKKNAFVARMQCFTVSLKLEAQHTSIRLNPSLIFSHTKSRDHVAKTGTDAASCLTIFEIWLRRRVVLRWQSNNRKMKPLRLRQTVLLCFYGLYLHTANGAARHICPPTLFTPWFY